MIPIELTTKPFYSDRDKMFIEEIQAFIDADVDAAILKSDESVNTQRNVQLYKKMLRRMRVFENYQMCQRKGQVIIHKNNVRV